jgi:anti-anti-sigma factor
MHHTGSRLTIEITVFDDQHVVQLGGEVDMATTPELDNAVTDVGASDVRTVIVDLRNVTFMDASGLRSLLAANAACCERGQELRIIPGSRVQRLLEVTGSEPDLPLTSAFEARG